MGREISTSGGRVGGSTWWNILKNSKDFLLVSRKQKIVAGGYNIC